MKKRFKRLMCVLTAVVMLMTSLCLGSLAAGDKTPIILIPGFGQSDTFVYDESGEYIGEISEFDLPALENIGSLVTKLIGPVLLSAATRQDVLLSKAVDELLREIFKPFALNDDGTPVYTKRLVTYDAPYSQLSSEERAEIYSHVSLDGISEYDDVRYYYTYDTFGSIKDAAQGLHDYIHNVVLKQTGADKVTLCPISQGGTVLVMYLDMFPEDHGLIKKIVNMIPAFDGSEILGNVLEDKVTVHDLEYLHSVALPSLLGDNDKAYAISLAIRLLLSSKVQSKVIRQALETAKQMLVVNSSAMWALCPSAAYQRVKDVYLSGEAHAAVRSETDAYELARSRFPDTLANLMQSGVTVHIISSYGVGYFLPELFVCGTQNADDLLSPASSALGTISADIGECFEQDYSPAGTYCSDETHSHISPDRTIDASAGRFPENTWYVKNVSHMGMNGRQDVKALAVTLLTDDSITDVYGSEKYSQFIDPTDFIAYERRDEQQGYIFYYDEDGNYLYYEKIQQPSEETTYLKCLFDMVNFIFRQLTARPFFK